jgi:hypothetical protein
VPELFHFSEDPTIAVFRPRDGWVWAVDKARSPSYWFPRDCPRATWWPSHDLDWSHRIHAIEWAWWKRFVACELYAYRMPAAAFTKIDDFWRSTETVGPLGVEPVGNLLEKHEEAGIELRLVTDLLDLWDDVITRPGIDFSGIRLRNASSPR